MKAQTVTTAEHLKTGDRFHKLSDKLKVVYQITHENLLGKMYYNQVVDGKKKLLYDKSIDPFTAVVFLRKAEPNEIPASL